MKYNGIFKIILVVFGFVLIERSVGGMAAIGALAMFNAGEIKYIYKVKK